MGLWSEARAKGPTDGILIFVLAGLFAIMECGCVLFKINDQEGFPVPIAILLEFYYYTTGAESAQLMNQD